MIIEKLIEVPIVEERQIIVEVPVLLENNVISNEFSKEKNINLETA